MLSFVYLVQTSGGIPLSYSWIKDKNRIILSYKHNTPETDIFYPGSSWTDGRNRLFEIATKNNKYDYYVFLDDDLGITPEKIEEFESSLNNFTDYPPVVLPKMWKYNEGKTTYKIKYNRKGLQNNNFKFQTVDWFDAAFNAFHKDAINKLLPYDNTYDKQSWHYSQLLLIFKSNFLYYNKITQMNNINILENRNHSPYPKDFSNVSRVVDEYIKNNEMENLIMSDGIEVKP